MLNPTFFKTTRQVLLILAAAGTLSSCASLPAFLGGGQPRDPYEELAERDPVAAMALRIRNGGRMPASSDQVQADEIRLSMARSRQDIATGMSMSDVVSLWGNPREVEKAGDPGSGNERWTYFEGLSSPWSLSTARRIYFEHGRVTGWETIKP